MTTEDRATRLRTDFEAWTLAKFDGAGCPPESFILARERDGDYKLNPVQAVWEGYEAGSDTRAKEMAGLLREAADRFERLWIFEHPSDEGNLRMFVIRLRSAADRAAKDPTP